MADERERPLLRVVRGNPDDAELAAVAAVVVGIASSAGEEPTAEPNPSRWADRAALVRQPLPTGPGAWRAAGR
jgi:Acyl-CoA carboxylase epsilon subunit